MRSLGHEKIETTMIYLEKVFKREKHAIHALERGSVWVYISQRKLGKSCPLLDRIILVSLA